VNVQEQVARLEALLTKIQYNGASLRQERGVDVAARAQSTPAETPRAVTHGTPTKLLPTSMDGGALQPAAFKSTPPAKPSSIPAAAQTLVPASNEPLETDYTGTDVETDEFGREESFELTKPLWVGVEGVGLSASMPSEPAPQPQPAAPATLPPMAFTPVTVSTGSSLPPLPEDTQEPGLQGFEPVPTHESTDSELSDSSPPLSGERASTRSPSLLPQDAPMSLEEPLASAVGAQIPLASPGFGSEPDAAVAISTASFDAGSIAEDRDSRISDAPASALGSIINLPEDDIGDVELELAEPPPSSLRAIAPTPKHNADELEADLPRTSYRAAYDDSLSSPPAAREELIAHDLNVRERIPSAPAPGGYISESPLSEATHPGLYVAPLESDLPPVLSSRPQSPVTIPPQSTVELLRASADREEVASFDAPPFASYEAKPQPAFEAPFTDAAHASVPPYQTSVSDVVVSARATPQGVEFVPAAHAVAATFEGSVPRTQDASFLELLDTSLSLTARE
jgi:hypothetical protein